MKIILNKAEFYRFIVYGVQFSQELLPPNK